MIYNDADSLDYSTVPCQFDSLKKVFNQGPGFLIFREAITAFNARLPSESVQHPRKAKYRPGPM